MKVNKNYNFIKEREKNIIRLVRCISERKSMPEQLIVGKKYWVDDSTIWKDSDGNEYVQVYFDEAKENWVGNMLTTHFETIYRYLNYGISLSNYVNTDIGFLLKDIINWCLRNWEYQLSEKLIMYIHDNNLDKKENMEKEFIVNSTPSKEFVERGMEEEYMKYLGYSMYCID